MKKLYTILLGVIILTAFSQIITSSSVEDFQTCIEAGNVVTRSYPRQCKSESGDMYTEKIVQLSSEQGKELAAYIQNLSFNIPQRDLGQPFNLPGASTIIVSAEESDSYTKTIIREHSWNDAAKKAAQRIQNNTTALTRVDFVVDTLEEVYKNDDWENSNFLHDRSLVGLAPLGLDGEIFLPIENVTKTLVNSSGEIRPNNIAEHLSDQDFEEFTSRKTILPFVTKGFLLTNNGPQEIYRGHLVMPNQPTIEQLQEAIDLSEQYLVKEVDDKGKYTYIYHPKTDELIDGYNILRHAGTTWSLLQLYEHNQNEESLDAAKRAIGYLQEQTVPCPRTKVNALCLLEKGHVKVGANGLALLALAKYQTLTGDDSFEKEMIGYANRLVEIQDEAGEFTRHKESYPEGVDTGFISGYYPGEAIFGLTALYKLDGNTLWLDTASKGAKWLGSVRDKDTPIEQLYHDHWLLYGLNELHELRPEDVYVTQTRRISQAIIRAQNDDTVAVDYDGSWYEDPRSTPAATRAEGLMAAYKLFQRIEDIEAANEILNTTRRSIRYQLATQITPDIAMFLPNGDRALGGFRKSFTSFEIRVDYVQHNASALIYYLEALRDREEG